MNATQIIDRFYPKFLSAETKEKGESIIIKVAIASFVLHLLLIFLVDLNILAFEGYSDLLNNPIAAIYTPFSFILIYEVYLLIYYLPQSITTYIGKQYEIITLIIIRRIFKDLSNLELTTDWFSTKYDLQFTYDITATIFLFFLIYLFYKLNKKRKKLQKEDEPIKRDIQRFIKQKKVFAILLVPVFVLVATYTFGHWIYESLASPNEIVNALRDVNKIFFNEFFTVLIMTDILLLLISFLYTDHFNTIMRNSGFLISTILIKLSFGVDGLLNTLLIVVAVLFGVIILAIQNQYEKLR